MTIISELIRCNRQRVLHQTRLFFTHRALAAADNLTKLLAEAAAHYRLIMRNCQAAANSQPSTGNR